MQKSYDILIRKLNIFIREYYKNLIIRGFIYSLTGMLSMLILFTIIEHFNFFNSTIRSFLFWAYCIVNAVILIRLVIIPAIKMFRMTTTISHKDAATIIGKHFKEVSDKLTNILELKQIDQGSEDLIEASINQKIKKIEFTPFNKAIDWPLTINQSKYLLIPCLLVLVVFMSGNKNIISESAFRIINYNTPFVKPAPFYFNLTADSLFAIENSDLTIFVKTTGEELPKNVYINYGGDVKKMTPLSREQHSYTFKNIRENISFYFSANDEYSPAHLISMLNRPQMEMMKITIVPPKHTELASNTHLNRGSIQVPEGSTLVWEMQTSNADSLKFKINDKTTTLTASKNDNYFKKSIIIKKNSEYSISLANKNVSFSDTTFYNLQVRKDAYPSIAINTESDTDSLVTVISGVIRDDYGFSGLTHFTRIYGLDRDTFFQKNIAINFKTRSQTFIQPLVDKNINTRPGESIECYFKVFDNDAPNGYKATESSTITINTDTYEQAQEIYDAQSVLIKETIGSEISMLQSLEKDLTNFEKDLIKKDSLDWKDRKKVQDIIDKQSNLERKIEGLKNQALQNFNQLNSTNMPSPEILKKQQDLAELFEKLIPEEMKELYSELERLKDALQKDKLQQKIQELKLSNEDLEKELDRNLEILKQLEFEQKLDNIIERLNALKKSQIELSQDTKTPPVEKIESQKRDNKEFKNIQKEIEEIRELNTKLETKKKIQETQQAESDINEKLENGKTNLEKGNKKKANKTQKETGQKLGELANFFSNMKKQNDEDQNYEDMEVLRQILENLVYFSIEEERILLEFSNLEKDDPQYVELMHTQQRLRDASRVIEDSLFALSKRVPQISSKINREINSIDKKTSSAIDYLRERLTLKAVQDQQFIMTSANNLALLLSQILEDMQKDLANSLPSTQQCEKPGKSKPKPGDLKKMQEQLNNHLKELQEKLKNGEQNNMQKNEISQQLVEMLAKQELIRHSLEELKEQMTEKEDFKLLQKTIDEMKKTEKDIANQRLNTESLLRQKQILTRLLELDEALREQGEDNKRESKTSMTEYQKIIQDAYEKYEQEKLKETEMLKTTPPSLKDYYKDKVNRYFNLTIQ